MKIPVVGMDPSLRNWGLAEAVLDLDNGYLSTPVLSLVQPQESKGKSVRQNSKDLEIAELLAAGVIPVIQKAKAVFVEVPHGSPSARAMASYGVCVGVLGSIRALGIELIEVSATENKKTFTGLKSATKDQMIAKAMSLYPDANWPFSSGKVNSSKAEHMADAIAAIHAGVQTPVFQNMMRLLAKV